MMIKIHNSNNIFQGAEVILKCDIDNVIDNSGTVVWKQGYNILSAGHVLVSK